MERSVEVVEGQGNKLSGPVLCNVNIILACTMPNLRMFWWSLEREESVQQM